LLSNVRNNEYFSTEHILVTLNKAPQTPRKTSRSLWFDYEDSRLLRCEAVLCGGQFSDSTEI
jgi:hypothetical protein